MHYKIIREAVYKEAIEVEADSYNDALELAHKANVEDWVMDGKKLDWQYIVKQG